MKRGRTKHSAKKRTSKAAGKVRSPARSAETAAKAQTAASRRRRPASSAARTQRGESAGALQNAAASLSDGDILEILADLSWPSRAKWLSSYFADRLPEEVLADDDGLVDSLDEIGEQVATLLAAMDDERPADLLSAVTCCFSSDPAHVEAGLSWLEDNAGTRMIDLDALDGLPGYRAVADILNRVREEPRAR